MMDGAFDEVPDGWGVFGMMAPSETGQLGRVWLKKLPLPDDLPTGWPDYDTNDDVTGYGVSMRAAVGMAVRKIHILKAMEFLL